LRLLLMEVTKLIGVASSPKRDAGKHFQDRTSLSRALCAFVVAYNITVIVWGAYVRATGSGQDAAVTGLCARRFLLRLLKPNGNRIRAQVTSGLSLVLVAFFLFGAGVALQRATGLATRLFAAAVLLFNESFLGALLVLVDHVGGLTISNPRSLLCLHLEIPSCCLLLWHSRKVLSNRYTSGVVPKPFR